LNLLVAGADLVVALILVVAEGGKRPDAVRERAEGIDRPVRGQQRPGPQSERPSTLSERVDVTLEAGVSLLPLFPRSEDWPQIPLDGVRDRRTVAGLGSQKGPPREVNAPEAP
jgi:hypothetical protein